MASIFDIKDDGEFRVVGIEEEKNRGIITETFRKHCSKFILFPFRITYQRRNNR